MKSARKRILINGYFLCRKLTGIERYAFEITRRLDKLCLPDEVAIIIPSDAVHIPEYKNIRIIRHGKMIRHIFWQMFTLQSFLLTHREYTVLDFGNTALPFAPGIVFLHDIYCEFFPEDFTGVRDRLARIYNRWQYRLIARKAKKIGTVSYFSRNQIMQTYHVPPEKIVVIYNSYDHFNGIKADYSVFDKFSVLANPFYLSLGSLSKRKNIRWIVDYAANHPQDIFAISGDVPPTARDDCLSNSTYSNIILLGYLDDSKIKALMERCKAFLLPSYYEGFGNTPLEALSCGAKIIVANAASLPEIYDKSAHYIDPFNTEVNLDALLREPVEPADLILDKFSFDKSAKQVYDLIKSIIT